MQVAWKEREHARRRTEAMWVANLMNATGNFEKEPVTIEMLLPEGPGAVGAKLDAIRQRAEQRKAERLKARRNRERSSR